MNVMKDGRISDRFLTGDEPIRPVIFSHGLSGNYALYTGIARDYASHGYLFIMPHHQDGSCTYTETKKGRPMYYKSYPLYDKGLRQRQQSIRVKELLSLIEELIDMSPQLHE